MIVQLPGFKGGGCLLLGLAIAWGAAAEAPPSAAPSRGELLYSLHCIDCHTSQMHWRKERRATDWASLVAQVDRWQNHERLGWDKDDVSETARYLNAVHYHFAAPARP